MKKSENRECLCHKIIYLLSMLIVATTNGLLDGNIVILNTTVVYRDENKLMCNIRFYFTFFDHTISPCWGPQNKESQA